MLKNLYIENVAVTKQLSVDFENGFSVITGETGAGKSIVIDSLEALAGAKLGRDMIRSGESKATVSAVFSDLGGQTDALSALGAQPDENGELHVLRTFTADGKSNVKINMRPIAQSALKEIGAVLLSINSQGESRELLDRSALIGTIDIYAGNESLLDEYAKLYSGMTEIREEANALRKSVAEKTMMTDILKYQINEIESAKLSDPDEEDKLDKLRKKLKGIEQIAKNSALVYRALAQSDKASASYLISRAASAVRQLSDVMEDADEIAARLDGYRYEIEDIAERVHDIVDDDDMANPEEKLNSIEKRLSQIEKLKRKYGGSIAEIVEFKNNAKKKLSDLDAGDIRIAELEKEYAKRREEAMKIADRLSESRCKAAQKFTADVLSTLVFLDMPKVRFVVDISAMHAENGMKKLNSRGYDDVDFLMSANPGEPPQSISKVASGGELSRVMLAVKSTMSRQAGAGTLIFDEIDSGVSGATAEKIGIKLKEIAKDAQVIAVTHSPQIASLADTHYLIKKQIVDGRSESRMIMLDYDGRVAEISRIIGGVDITEKQIAAAKEMIFNKQKILSGGQNNENL